MNGGDSQGASHTLLAFKLQINHDVTLYTHTHTHKLHTNPDVRIISRALTSSCHVMLSRDTSTFGR